MTKEETWQALGKLGAVKGQMPGGNWDLKGAVLSGADLAGADLEGADLQEADLTGANLERVNLHLARLQRIKARGAHLRGAQLRFSSLEGASLEGADLSEASLDGAFLQRALLAEARLQGIRAQGAILTDANMQGANLAGAYLGEANLEEANLTNAVLQGADLTNAILEKSHFVRADLEKACLRGVAFRNANLEGANVRSADMRGVSLENCNVMGIRYSRKTLFMGARVESCYGNTMFKRFAVDQQYIEELRGTPFGFVVYAIWLVLADCGRSLWVWSLWSALIAVGFGCKYFLLGPEAVKVNALPWGLKTMIYYSVITMTTLGYGDIYPATVEAANWVMTEVIVGYVMLGGLISIFASKLARRG